MIIHSESRGRAPVEGLIPSHYTEDEAGALEKERGGGAQASSLSVTMPQQKGGGDDNKAFQNFMRADMSTVTSSSFPTPRDKMAMAEAAAAYTSPKAKKMTRQKSAERPTLQSTDSQLSLFAKEGDESSKFRPPSLTGTRGCFYGLCCCCCCCFGCGSRSRTKDGDKSEPGDGGTPFELNGLSLVLAFRNLCFYIAETKAFDRFILSCIVLNSVTLAIYDPRGLTTLDEKIPLETLDLCFLIIFLWEAVVKISAYGLITTKAARRADAEEDACLIAAGEEEKLMKKGGRPKRGLTPTLLPRHPRYLDENWNRLDFFIVLSSLMYFMQYIEGLNLKSTDLDVLRTLRMLRPLRTIHGIPEMRILIDSLGESAKPMANVMMLCSFLFLVFALVGQQLFSGAMMQRCFRSGYHESSTYGSSNLSYPTRTVSVKGEVTFGVTSMMPDNYTTPIIARRCGGAYTCPDGWVCRIGGIRPDISNEHSTSWGGLGTKRYFGNDYANPNFGGKIRCSTYTVHFGKGKAARARC